jgi:hypothetical protein
VFDCFLYDGENEHLLLKLSTMSSYVSSFVIVEGEHFEAGAQAFKFSWASFVQHSDQIVYLPVRSLPHRKVDLQPEEREANQKYLHEAYAEALQGLARPRDVVILSDVGDILDRKAVERFQSSDYPYACTETLVYVEYFNRMAVRAGKDSQKVPLLWTEGARMTRPKTLEESFRSSPHLALSSDWCRQQPAPPTAVTYRKAGWSFVKKNLTIVPQLIKQLYGEFETYDIEPEAGYLPKGLAEDILEKQEESVYAGLITYLRAPREAYLEKSGKGSPFAVARAKKDKKRAVYDSQKLFRSVVSCIAYSG